MSQRAQRWTSTIRLAGLGVLALAIASGCYSKVVEGRGIGADSTDLRKNHEFGSPNPVQDVLTREENRR